MVLSAAEHWIGSDALRRHYAASVLGPAGLLEVAVAQSVAAVGLLWPRFQSSAGLMLVVVMLAAASSHVRSAGIDARIWQPLAIAVWALIPSVVLIIRPGRRV